MNYNWFPITYRNYITSRQNNQNELDRLVASHWVVSVGSILGTVLFNIFINDPDAGLKCIQIKFAGDTKLGGTVNSLSRGKAIGEILTNQRAWQSPTTLSLTRENPAFCTGNRQPWLHLHTGEQEAGEQHCGKESGGSGWCQAEYEFTVRPGRQKDQPHHEVHQAQTALLDSHGKRLCHSALHWCSLTARTVRSFGHHNLRRA